LEKEQKGKKTMDEKIKDYAVEYIKFLGIKNKNSTVDDFFDFCKIPYETRSDFLYGAILKQAQKYLDGLSFK
jgi:hypothetical protein